jgi:hypothetical protein
MRMNETKKARRLPTKEREHHKKIFLAFSTILLLKTVVSS